MWDLVSKETVCSVLAHDNAITALCVSLLDGLDKLDS